MGKLRDAIDYVEANHPLPRCSHGQALRDHSGEALEPPCGCRATNSEPSVEEALRELREMFGPRKWVEITVGTSMDGYYYKVKVYGMRRLPAMSLSAAMAEVRKWKQEQSS